MDVIQTDSKVRGLIFMNLFCFIMTVMSCIFKKLAVEGVSNMDFAVFRTLVGLTCISLYNWYKKTKPWSILSPTHYTKMLFRSFLGIWGFIMYTYIITILPLTLTTVVFQTESFLDVVAGNLLSQRASFISRNCRDGRMFWWRDHGDVSTKRPAISRTWF